MCGSGRNNWKYRVLWFHLYNLWTNTTIRTMFTSTLLSVVSNMSYCYIVCKSFLSVLQQLSPERLFTCLPHTILPVLLSTEDKSVYSVTHPFHLIHVTMEWYLFIYVHNTVTEAVCWGLPDGIPARQIRKNLHSPQKFFNEWPKIGLFSKAREADTRLSFARSAQQAEVHVK